MMSRRGNSPEMYFLGTLGDSTEGGPGEAPYLRESHQDDLTKTRGHPGIFLLLRQKS